MSTHSRLSSFFSDKHINFPICGSGLLLIISWLYALSFFSSVPDKIIAHTNIYHEIDVLTSRGYIYNVLFTWCLLLCANVFLAYALHARNPLWARILLYGMVPIAIIALVYVRLLVMLNV